MTKAIELSQLGSNVDVGTEIESSLPLRTNNATYGNNTDVPYLIAGTSGYTGATTNWNTFGLQHRFKSNSSGSPRVTIDSTNGELFTVHNNGNVGIGTSSPTRKLEIQTGTGTAGFKQSSSSLATTLEFLRNGVGTITNNAIEVSNSSGIAASINYGGGAYFAGNVGIGTTIPSEKLGVSGNANAASDGGVLASEALFKLTRPGVVNESYPSAASFAISRYTDEATNGKTQLDIDLINGPTSTPDVRVMSLRSDGNVGIGTTAPGQTLHVGHNTAPKIRFSRSSSYYWDIGHTSSDFQFESQTGGVIMHMNYDGNVGIGTNSPAAKLHIQGTSIQVAGAFGSNVTYGGRDIQANQDIRSTSMRGGVLVRNMNDYRTETASASFMHYDAYTTSARSYAFRAARGATLSDTFWVKSDGSMYAASTFSGNSISLTSNITQTASAPQHIFRENGTTYGNTTWALVRDGDSFSIRWNNATPYAFRAATGSGSFTSVFLRGSGLEVNASGTVIAGSLSKGSGSFRIQHPLDELSETTDLVHSFVEAPDASNLYAGMVDLVNGTATVNIDTAHRMTEGTFVALNHVQSWSSSNESGYAPVKCSISGNLLTIECQDTSSTDTVYYEVRGIRKDQHMIDTDWTDDNGRVITEPPKRAVPE